MYFYRMSVAKAIIRPVCLYLPLPVFYLSVNPFSNVDLANESISGLGLHPVYFFNYPRRKLK